MSGAIQLIRRPHERELTDDALAAPKRFHGRQYTCKRIAARFGQDLAAEGLERHPRGACQGELAEHRELALVDEERIGCSCDAMDLGLRVLGLELLREQGELRLGTGTQHKALFSARPHQFQRKRLVGGAGLEPGLHGLRLALPLLVWHNHDQVGPALRTLSHLLCCEGDGRGRGKIVRCGCFCRLRHDPVLLLFAYQTLMLFAAIELWTAPLCVWRSRLAPVSGG